MHNDPPPFPAWKLALLRAEFLSVHRPGRSFAQHWGITESPTAKTDSPKKPLRQFLEELAHKRARENPVVKERPVDRPIVKRPERLIAEAALKRQQPAATSPTTATEPRPTKPAAEEEDGGREMGGRDLFWDLMRPKPKPKKLRKLFDDSWDRDR